MTSLASRHRQVLELTFQTSQFATTTVTIALKQVTDPVRASLIRQQLGLNDAVLVLEGRLVEPRLKPDALKAGYEAPLTWAGRGGTARLEPYQGAIREAWRQKYGDKLLVSWRTDEIP